MINSLTLGHVVHILILFTVVLRVFAMNSVRWERLEKRDILVAGDRGASQRVLLSSIYMVLLH
jgi:hypothetical protein